MADIELALTDTGYDTTFGADGDFTMTDGAETAILMSVYCEQRAEASQMPIPQMRRGWWGNELAQVTGYQQGSLLWLLSQARADIDTLNLGANYLRQGFQWMVDDALLKDVSVTGILLAKGARYSVKLTRIDGQTETRYYDLWEATQSVH